MGKLFGTDGIRGVANEEPMTPETVVKLGRAAAYLFKTKAGRHSIVIGKDTRLHGYMLECALTSGICSMGVDVLLVGPLPTPGIAFITRSLRADAGIVISASHNPFKDNGIKFFSGEGLKLPDEMEERMEALITGREIERLRPLAAEIGKAYRINDAAGRYIEFAKGTIPKGVSFHGVKVVVDCAHGATYKVAPTILNELGAVVIPVNIQPNGININDRCGSLYPDVVKKAVLEHRADIGISYDGDGDRAILVDETGAVVDGDHILAICALDLKRSGLLRSDTLVATVMSNIGLELCLKEVGIRMVRVPVGDRYVLEEMLQHGYNLGGEQSGHIVFLDHNTTGDGVVTALQVLSLMVKRQERLSQLRQCMTVCPQLLVNVQVTEMPDLGSIPAIQAVISDAEAQLNGSGRVLVRYSGTEPVARVMVEGTDAEQVKFLARSIAEAIEKELG
ncbi:MAG: phosphoglucosamine mutase [Candidatus Methylomirabilales bacterium]|nr:phosphoglucosamine mutase [candidate division NC10 bacterium]